jgi:sulfofructose kinase
MAEVLVLGLAVADFVFGLEHLPDKPVKYRAERGELVGGGGGGNAAVAIARLGGTARLLARLGDDRIGDLILEGLEAERIDTNLVHRSPGGRSSFSAVLVDAAGERQIINYRGDRLVEATGWIATAPRADAVLADTRWNAGAQALLERAHAWGVPGVVDAEAPVDITMLQAASHVAFSRQGLLSLTAEKSLPKALAQIADALPGWTCVTDGENGAWYMGENGPRNMPAFKVSVRDTLGAGDVWHGAFTLALAEGAEETGAMRFANAAAALKCTRFGGRAGCPDRAEVTEFERQLASAD